jgi:tRNA(adenine34) deaminase
MTKGEVMRTDLLAPELKSTDFERYMREALNEAEEAGMAGELPIGAVLVVDGEIVSRHHAHHQRRRSQLEHAEINALRNGGPLLWERHEEAILFTTLEPCPMCLGAVVMADVPHIIFASHDEMVHSRQIVATNPYVQRHIKSYYGGVLEKEARVLMGRYHPKLLRHASTTKHVEL